MVVIRLAWTSLTLTISAAADMHVAPGKRMGPLWPGVTTHMVVMRPTWTLLTLLISVAPIKAVRHVSLGKRMGPPWSGVTVIVIVMRPAWNSLTLLISAVVEMHLRCISTAADIGNVSEVHAGHITTTITVTPDHGGPMKTDGTAVALFMNEYGGVASSVDLTNVTNMNCGAWAYVALIMDGTTVGWGADSAGGDPSGV